MKSKLIPVLAAALVAATPAFAASVTIDFEAPPSFASIDQFYSGVGVTFGLDALAVQNDAAGPYFSNAPSPIGVMSPVGTAAAMNFAVGFTGLASFSYSSTDTATVGVWTGLDGTGTLLGSFSLSGNAQAGGCTDAPFCNWDVATFTIAAGDVARSIAFGDATGLAGFDDVTISAVPLPAAGLLLPLGAALLGFAARRRRAT